MTKNRKILLIFGVFVASLIALGQSGYYYFQNQLAVSILVEKDAGDNQNTEESHPQNIIEIDDAISTIGIVTFSVANLTILKGTYIEVKEKTEIWLEHIKSKVNFFKTLTHCIIPINAP